jgi:hypothetical protein
MELATFVLMITAPPRSLTSRSRSSIRDFFLGRSFSEESLEESREDDERDDEIDEGEELRDFLWPDSTSSSSYDSIRK